MRAWGERGWCRLENLANSLSPTQKSFIVAQSATSIFSYGPSGMIGRLWYDEVVGTGNFAVEADKLSLGHPILQMITLRKGMAEDSGDLPFYRFLCAMTKKLLDGCGAQTPSLPLDEWLKELRFTTTVDEAKSGLSPLRFAVIAQRVDLVAQILEHPDVDVEAPIKPPKKGTTAANMFLAGQTILISAALFNDKPDIVKLLLAKGANPRVTETNPPFCSPLMSACISSHDELIDPLLASDPTLWQIPHVAGILPFEEFLMVGSPKIAEIAFIKYKEQLRGLPSGVPRFLNLSGKKGMVGANTQEEHDESRGARYLWFAVNHIGDIRTVKMLLEQGCDPNGDCSFVWGKERSTTIMNILVKVFVVLFDRQRSPIDLAVRFANMQSGPLHMACLTGNIGAVDMMLAYGAKADSLNHWRRLTPMHCAAACGHEAVIDSLLRAAPVGVNLAAIKDKKGKTPAQRAAKRGYTELASRLQKLEATSDVSILPAQRSISLRAHKSCSCARRDLLTLRSLAPSSRVAP